MSLMLQPGRGWTLWEWKTLRTTGGLGGNCCTQHQVRCCALNSYVPAALQLHSVLLARIATLLWLPHAVLLINMYGMCDSVGIVLSRYL